METEWRGGRRIGRMMFKSYYVVWKQTSEKIKKQKKKEFKSYYVVWKQVWIYRSAISNALFKSYYVVWKL